MGGKIGEGGCTVRAISVWSGFSWREVWARLKALRVSLVRLREGLAHISHTESYTGQEPWFSMYYWHGNPGAIVSVCPAGLYFTICEAKGHLGPSQFDSATHRKSFSFNSPSCLSSWLFYLLPSTLNSTEEIPFSENTLPVLDSVVWLPSLSLRLWPLVSVWHRLVQTRSHWETPVLKALGKFLWPPKELLSSQASSLAKCRS